jgi:hypothetical protein
MQRCLDQRILNEMLPTCFVNKVYCNKCTLYPALDQDSDKQLHESIPRYTCNIAELESKLEEQQPLIAPLLFSFVVESPRYVYLDWKYSQVYQLGCPKYSFLVYSIFAVQGSLEARRLSIPCWSTRLTPKYTWLSSLRGFDGWSAKCLR